MSHQVQNFPFQDVVLVADSFTLDDTEVPAHERRDLEKTDVHTLDFLQDAIATLGLTTHVYTGPQSLADHAIQHKEDIVLSIYGGQSSRNRMALVPAICETFGLRFIGPDVYGRVIAQDKEITKRLAVDCGVRTPAWRVVRDISEIRYASRLKLPVVVKPLMEGSSIGISQRNLAYRKEDVEALIEEMLSTFHQPILVEEFIAGREVAYCRIQGDNKDAWAFSEVVIEGDTNYFETRLFDAGEKLAPSTGRGIRNIDAELDDEERAAIERFLAAFGRYGYCRVDGRLNNGQFHFLELTPDAWIAPRGQFARGYTGKGWAYSDVIAAVLTSAE